MVAPGPPERTRWGPAPLGRRAARDAGPAAGAGSDGQAWSWQVQSPGAPAAPLAPTWWSQAASSSLHPEPPSDQLWSSKAENGIDVTTKGSTGVPAARALSYPFTTHSPAPVDAAVVGKRRLASLTLPVG